MTTTTTGLTLNQNPIRTEAFAESELILRNDGSVYHLGVRGDDVANRVILVGDPDRVDLVARHFDERICEKQSREFRTLTGRIGNINLSVVSTGIGTDNIDIVLNELDAAVNIDPETRHYRLHHRRLKLLRLGTAGGLQPDTELGSIAATRYALGMDALGHFHRRIFSGQEVELKNRFRDHLAESYPDQPLLDTVYANESQFNYPDQPNGYLYGLTVTAPGFFVPQGRALGKLQPAYPNLPEVLAAFRFEELPLLNLEMETAGILFHARGLQHQAGALSVLLANRRTGEFTSKPEKHIETLVRQGVETILAA